MSLLDSIENNTRIQLRSYIDSRDLIQARDEAREQLDAHFAASLAERVLDEDELAELREIVEGVTELENEGCGEDWAYGATLIPEHEWLDYAEQYAQDVQGMDRDQSWPYNHIDWQAAADELAMDYTQVDIDGTTYYVR